MILEKNIGKAPSFLFACLFNYIIEVQYLSGLSKSRGAYHVGKKPTYITIIWMANV